MRVNHPQWRVLCVAVGASLAVLSAAGRASAVCGDGTVDAGEACDDGNRSDFDACHNDCTLNKCGNGAMDAPGEECDDGGLCVSGDNAGKPCPATISGGVDCGAGNFCKPFGGDGCAANCIPETTRAFAYDPAGTFSQIQGASLGLKFPILGNQVLTTSIHPDLNGNYAVVIKASDVHIQPIKVGTPGNLCACVRGQAVKTCGGATTGRQCTTDDHICDGKGEGPCLFVHGPGNAASGVIGCGPNGLTPIDVDLAQDHNTRFNEPDDPCTSAGERLDMFLGHEGACNGRVMVTAINQGPTGSALLLNSLNIQTISDKAPFCTTEFAMICNTASGNKGVNCTTNPTICTNGGSCIVNPNITKLCKGGDANGQACTGNPDLCGDPGLCVAAKGADLIACTDDDPITAQTATVPLTTGLASASISNATDSEGVTIGPDMMCPMGGSPCKASQQGSPFSCSALAANPHGGVGGAKLGSAFPALDASALGDLVVSTSLQAPPDAVLPSPTPTNTVSPTATPTTIGGTCVGDCGNGGSVTIDKLVKGLNISLGTEPLTDCPQFDPDHSSSATVNELAEGVNNALHGCP